MEMKHRKQKKENAEESSRIKENELQWGPEHSARPIGKVIKITNKQGNEKCHYERFKFRGRKYGLISFEGSVILFSEDASKKLYVAIIKDIYVQGKKGYVKLKVHWFYHLEDVDKKYVRNWKSKDSKDIFYRFHRDEVFAESVKDDSSVYFVPDNKQVPNHGFIVQRVYNTENKKLRKFTFESW
ncbi:unnamed protein product [Thlaspi arvense]|uniref:BAH domain-containing protein n=1 Tax=Thlaspi arvense TaxID=13288 RepID=A0AAU9S9C6_THLAR|nr:unnamed protein product [Thlaspi arvense]